MSATSVGTREKAARLPLETAIRQKTAQIGVIGLGYVGLPLIRTFVAAGFRTLGFDVDARKVESLQAGRSYIGHIASEWIARCVGEGKFTKDKLDTFGGFGVAEIPDLQLLLQYICENGFEHHVAVNHSESARAVHEAFEKYMGWDVYWHE